MDRLGRLESVLHPLYLSRASENAFVHALAIAFLAEARFTMLYSGRTRPSSRTWARYPRVRDTLVRWGLLAEGSPKSAVDEELGMAVEKVAVHGRNTVGGILDYMDAHPVDLMVLATAGRRGLSRWLHPSVAERTARRSKTHTLFMPANASGFISHDTGRASLRRILVGVDREPSANAALEMAAVAADAFGDGEVHVDLVHVGSSFPDVSPPEDLPMTWSRLTRPGDPVDEIVRLAEDASADLIVMATAGHAGFADALRGSTTERVLRRASCPLLAVPSR